MEKDFRIAIDTGGTFTDVCLLDDSQGELLVTKVPSTPFNPAVGVIKGIKKTVQEQKR